MRQDSPRRVAAFLLLLVLPQAAGFAWQFKRGFRPLDREPVRVPLSWDMFAVRIERCTVDWKPPVRPGGRTLARLADLGAPLEWDYVDDSVDAYRQAALWGCRSAQGPTAASLRCFVPEGREIDDGFDCP